MEVKVAAMLAAVDARHLRVSAVCVELGISRQTFYKYRRRFTLEGPAGLVERSRRPRLSPAVTGEAMTGLIVAARAALELEGWDNGALSIYYRLLAEDQQPPAPRTIHRVLVRQGLVIPQPRKRRRSSYRRFQFPATDDCWQIDAFEHTLSEGTTVAVFELKDDCSRFLLDVRGWPAEDTVGAWVCLAEAIHRYGKPRMLLSDNSLAFSGRRIGQVVLVETNLITLGIKPITSSPRHPQTCGKNERGHQTGQRWLAHQPPAKTLAELQQQLDRYRDVFNHRPHQALDGATPLTARAARTRISPLDPLTVEHPTTVTTPTANDRGAIRVAGAIIGLGVEYAGQQLIVFNTNDHLLIFYRHHLVHELTLNRDRRYQPALRPRGNTRRRRELPDHQPQPPRPDLTPHRVPPSRPTRRRADAVKVEPPTRGTTLTASSTGR
jgi:transposase InsO family protein